jgi:hypothetical protein
MRIDSSGNVQLAGNIGLGGATPTTSGTGITFPASISASTNANTLDDYEEGTWTATFTGSATTSTGKYTKIGNRVFVQVYGQALNVTSAVGAVMGGLPFTIAGGDTGYSVPSVSFNTYAINGGGNGYFSPNTTTFIFVNENATTQPNSVVGTKVVMIAGFYATDGI